MTYTESVKNILNTDEIDTSVIDETVAEAVQSTAPKGFTSQIQLRSTTHSHASRGETGQVQTTMLGGTMRGTQSSNSRTRAVRLGFDQFIQIPNIWENRGRDHAENTYKQILLKDPSANKRLALDVALIVAYVGVSGAELDKTKLTAYEAARDARLELIARCQAGEQLTEEEIYLVEHPWVDTIPAEKTIQAHSLWDLERIAQYVVNNESVLKPAKLASELTFKQLIADVSTFITTNKAPGLGVACFGQMKADLPSASVFGAVSTNMAFTTAPAAVKASMFVAVGDNPTDESHAGAEFLSLKETNSGTFCEPALYDLNQFRENLSYLTPAQQAEAITGVYKAMALVTPSGGQRANLTRSYPELIVNVVSSLQPISFESSYSNPVVPTDGESEMLASAKQLLTHIAGFKSFVGEMGEDYVVLVLATPALKAQLGDLPTGFIACESMDDLIRRTNELTGMGK